MARRKVRLGFIVDDSKRKVTFKKRKNGLMKKADEISTLCGVQACAIVFSPYENQAAVWPDDPRARHVISLFQQVPEVERTKFMLDCGGLMRQGLEKCNEQLKKQVDDNRQMEVDMLLDECLASRMPQNLIMKDLDDLEEAIAQRMIDIDEEIAALKKSQMQEGEASGNAQMQEGEASGNAEFQMAQVENQDMGLDLDEGFQMPQWVTDWVNAPDDILFP